MPRGHVVPDGRKIATLRGHSGLTQIELALRAGYGLRTISKIEGGLPTTRPTLAAILVVLNAALPRPLEVEDLMLAPDKAAPPPVVDQPVVHEQVKVLELQADRFRKRGGAAARAVLIDTLRFWRLPAETHEICFHYGTSGTQLEGCSLSHPDDSEWVQVAGTQADARASSPLRCYGALKVALGSVVTRGPCQIQNQVEYLDGFTNPRQRWFQTYVEFPTDCLTLIVRFAAAQPYTSIGGACQRHPASHYEPAAQAPIGMPAGRMAYWRIATPAIGETYRLDWKC